MVEVDKMNEVCRRDMCNGCMACVDKCPLHCISIEDTMLSYNAIRDMDVCVKCNKCIDVCPNNSEIEKRSPIKWKQGWANWDIRKNSSSGGAAAAITKAFIESGGYVASCLFRDGNFIFEITNNTEIAKKFAGSKYVKSNPVGIYKKIQERLKTDKVLFIGLPCQVAGLKNFIRNQDNLYTIDLICHGTPSPKVLNDFLKENKIDIKDLKDIKFRTKNLFSLSENGSYIIPAGLDDYTIAFLESISYTENCYSCKFASIERISDLTLGDSWGTCFKEEEKKGISLVLIQNDRGKKLIDSGVLNLYDVDIEIAKQENHQLRHPSPNKAERGIFFKKILNGRSFSFTIFELYRKRVIKRTIKNALIKIGLLKSGGGTRY